MGTVLFAWELGGGFGHVGPMKVIAEALDRFGHRVVFSLKDPIAGRLALGSDWPLLAAPCWSSPTRPGSAFGAASYSDIMAVRGFSDEGDLERSVRAWLDLIALVNPDLIVADHSPTALLAAYGRVPAVVVGYGFYTPPALLRTFPPFRDGIPPVLQEAKIMENVRAVQRRLGHPVPEFLPQLFAGYYTHVYSVPELDPYARFRRTPGLGPIETMPVRTDLPEDPMVFAYLSAEHPRIHEITIALSELGMPVELHVRGATAAMERFMALRGLRVHEQPPPFNEVLPRCSAVLSHGSGGITHASLFGGRPQLLMPRHMEGTLAATLLQGLGTGVTINAGGEPSVMAAYIKEALLREELRERSQAAALRVQSRYSPASRSNLIDACNQVLSKQRACQAQGSNPHLATSMP